MIHPKIKSIYKNSYAGLLISEEILLCGNKFLLVFIINKENVLYDTVILPPAKYKQCEHSFTIYHTDGEPEVFYIVDNNTP